MHSVVCTGFVVNVLKKQLSVNFRAPNEALMVVMCVQGVPAQFPAPQTPPFQSVTHPSLTAHLVPSNFQTATAEKPYMTAISFISSLLP